MFDGVDNFLIDLKVDGTSSNTRETLDQWHCKEGFLHGFETGMIPNEFSTTRQVGALRVVVLGPPLCGKSYLASALADHYDVPHLTLKKALETYFDQEKTLVEAIQQLDDTFDEEAFQPTPADPKGKKKGDPIKEALEELDPQEDITQKKKALFALRSNKLKVLPEEGNDKKKQAKKKQVDHGDEDDIPKRGVRYEETVIQDAFRYALEKPEYINHGWVIDGFPKTIDDINALFAFPPPLKEVDESAKKKKGPTEPEYDLDAPRVANPLVLPSFVIELNTENVEELMRYNFEHYIDDALKETYHYCEQSIERRAKAWEERENIHDYLNELKTKDEKTTTFITQPMTMKQSLYELLKQMLVTLGEPQNYRAFSNQDFLQRLEAQTTQHLEETQEDQDVEENVVVEEEEHDQPNNMSNIEAKELEELKTRAHDVQEWMVHNVMTTLTKAMIELAVVQPKEPFAFL
eukprot:CAMPEP_0117423746 /NCGR_PEP_ID=MMETSP0758-20121206/4299_1 /TAXON_ID=63605 /ORGANISM="Percolomonas cosmopolitus, Strain AE-1 (ATCC 50343)" /LENGTH=462 /DNA_ID=CAMNT_0005207101 /DNA_START=796 /DNA_END=2181 /DNA_ORIENTATION=+